VLTIGFEQSSIEHLAIGWFHLLEVTSISLILSSTINQLRELWMGFKSFLVVYVSVMIAVSMIAVLGVSVLQSRNGKSETSLGTGHFSVVWKGFEPEYSDQFPDYYICINNLKDESLQMYSQLKIENYENVSLYFMINKYTEPPAGWFVGPQYFGLVAITDPIKTFTYFNINRTKPAAIPQGSLHESVELAVKAYYDSSYTQFYSQANFTVNFHFIDVTATVWSKVVYDNFDDGTTQGWSYVQIHQWQYYRSWPCSITPYYNYPFKSFDLIGNYTEAYLVAAVYTYATSHEIYLDGQLCFAPDTTTGTYAWYQIAIPLPLNKATTVGLAGVSYIDDVYVVAK
jgi:hypothetical protein